VKTDALRIAAYDAKTAPTTVGLKVAAQLTTMRQSFASMTNELVTKQLLTAAVLDSLGVVGILRGRYHAFSNRLFAIITRYNGVTCTAMAQIEHDRFESVCVSGTLIQIALDVYNLVVT
jgi:hypothetical protein